MSHSQNHCAYLDAMGVTIWVRRLAIPTVPETCANSEMVHQSPNISNALSLETVLTSTVVNQPSDILISAEAQDEAGNLSLIGIVSSTLNPSVVAVTPDDTGWETLRQEVTACTACKLHQTRTQTVFGVGNRHADWLLVGEAPGADEDAQGEPFVGRAGKLLNEMLLAANMPRERVFIANILKCRPPNNRDPLFEEMVHCTPFLRRQIALLQPKLIIALGRVAAQYLLDTQTPISKLRGQEFTYADTNIPLIPTYHPAYLLRSPQQKRMAWLDIQFIWRIYTRIQKSSS